MITQSSKLPSWLLVAATLFIVLESGCVSPYAGGLWHYDGATSGGGHYVGQINSNNRRHGQGTLTGLGGQVKYVGQWRDGKEHGQGTFTWPVGNKYVGQWWDGNYHGQGTLTYGDGGEYIGQFQNGNYHGQGTLTTNGFIFIGHFQNGKMNGRGTVTTPDGHAYTGQLQDSRFHGRGTFTYRDGRKHVGQWRDGLRDGEGTVTWPDGRVYVAQWRGDACQSGTLTHPDGRTQRGRFVNNVFVEEPGRAVGQKPPDCRLRDLPEVESQQSVAVLDFQVSEDLKRSVGQSLADVCRDIVLQSGRFILIERESIKAILDEEDFASTFDCDDTKCLVDFGEKLRAQKIIHGRVNKVGTSFLITIKILNVSSTEVEGLKTAKVSGGLEQALDFVQPITCEILRKSLTVKP